MSYCEHYSRIKIRNTLSLLALTFLLTSCVSTGVRHDEQAYLTTWQVKGRIAVRTDDQAFSGNLFWTKAKDKQEFKLFGPFGKLYARLTEDGDGAKLYLDGAGERSGVNADSLIREALGIDLPLSFLFYWIQGRSIPKAPGEYKVDSQGRMEELRFRDWTVDYHNYQYYGSRMLPSKIRIERPGQVLKLSLRDWQI